MTCIFVVQIFNPMRSFQFFILFCLPFLGIGQSAWINEFHYDNVGQDVGEGVEVVIDTTLLDWKQVYLTAYNGSNGKSYGGDLAMLNADTSNSIQAYKIFWFNFPGLQNGPKDGLCLFERVGGKDSLLQFISYEGAFLAQDGPAHGLSSIDIGVSESSTTSYHQSLQLQGYGLDYHSFQWASDSSSPAVPNENQGFYIPLSLASNSAHFVQNYEHQGALIYRDYQDTAAQGLLLAEFSIHDGKPSDSDTLATVLYKFQLALTHAHILNRIELQSDSMQTIVIREPQLENWVIPSDWIVEDDDSMKVRVFGWFKDLQTDKETLGMALQDIQSPINSSQLGHNQINLLDTNSNWVEVQASDLEAYELPDTLFAAVPCPTFYAFAVDTFGNLDVDFKGYLKYTTDILNFGTDSVLFNHGKAELRGILLHGVSQWYNLNLRSKLGTYTDSFFLHAPSFSKKLIISGVYDGPLAWGQPKGIELYALDSIQDLSQYAIGIANNGAGTDGPEIQCLPRSLGPGEFYYLCSDSASFASFFGFSPNQSHGLMNVNGDDAIELYYDSLGYFQGHEVCEDRFGHPSQIAVDWNYTDKWAYRKPGTIDSIFDYRDWYFSASGTFESASLNSKVDQPFPLASFQPYPLNADIIFNGRTWYPFPPLHDCSNYSAIILKGITRLDQDFAIGSLKLAPSTRLELDEDVQMQVLGFLENEGELDLWNKAAMVANDSMVYSGNGLLSVQSKIEVPDHLRFTFWSSPVEEANFHKVFGTQSNKLSNSMDWYYWSSLEQQWKSCSDSTILKPGRGYISTPSPQSNPSKAVYETRIFEGKPNSGPFKIHEPHQAGDYLLLGNPYPAPLDKQKFMAANPSLDGSIYLWDNSLSFNSQAYAIWNPNNSLAASPSARMPDSCLGIAQGFFVRTIQTGDSISFHPNMQLPSKPNRYKSKETLSIRIFKEGEEAHSKICHSSTPGSYFVKSVDALWKDGGTALAINPSVQGQLYSIKGLDLVRADTVDLYSRLDSGMHRISIEGGNSQSVYLLDLTQDLLWPISRYDYNFYSKSKAEGIRFKLLWGKEQHNLIHSKFSKLKGVSAYQKESALLWNSQESIRRIVLYDSEGRLILDQLIHNERTGEIPLPPVSLGVYTLQMVSSSGIISLKILLKP